jgi:hypothetical protein
VQIAFSLRGFFTLTAPAKCLELFPFAAQGRVVTRRRAECLPAVHVEMRGFESGDQAAATACRVSFMAAWFAAGAPALQHPLQ